MLEVPLKISFFCEHRNGRRAGSRIAAGDIHRLEVRTDHAARRRRLLHFGDDGARRSGERSSEVAPRSAEQRTFPQRLDRVCHLHPIQIHALVAYDVVENHRLLNATSCASFSAARPLSMASCAMPMPAWID